MNKDRIQGNWKQFTGKIKETWGKLTDDEINMLDGQREQFLGIVQERYGIAKDQAENELRKLEEERTAA